MVDDGLCNANQTNKQAKWTQEIEPDEHMALQMTKKWTGPFGLMNTKNDITSWHPELKEKKEKPSFAPNQNVIIALN